MTATTSTPPEIDLVRSFVNTIDYDEGIDELGSPAELHRWLVDQQRASTGSRATAADLDLALRLRAALRAELTAHHDHPDDHSTSPALDAVCRALPLRMVASDEGLAPCAGGIEGGLAEIVAAVAKARIRGTWPRLKICPADDCLWAFYDTSRNRSRRWCSMDTCGNRNKVRAFRDRTRD
jgi:predicted RNA-binding Zn ribbon-like protein